MEEPHSSSDDLQPQDLSSACGLPNIFDLTRSREECVLKASPIDALRVVPTPGWLVNPGTSNGTILPESDSDPLPTVQIPADEAFSNTAVMLSYLSRSHVFSEHSPVYGVASPFLRAYDPGKLPEDLALPVDQQISIPVGLTSCEPFSLMSPAQVVENMAALCYLQQPSDMENLALETLKSLQANPSECRFPIGMDELHNGNAVWNIEPFEGRFPEDNGTDSEGLSPNANPELVFLISRSEEPIDLPNETEAASFAMPLNQEFISPLDPGSPPAEQMENVFPLPPEAVNPKQEEESDLTTEPTNDPSAGQTDTSDGSSSQNTKKTKRKKLPPRVRRGTRMAAIQNIQPVRSNKSRSQAKKNKSSTLLERMCDVSEENAPKEEPEIRRSKRRKATRSTSSSANPQKSSGRIRNHHSLPRTTAHKRQKKSQRKRKKHKVGRTSFFSPPEPEIKLKCLNYKEEKKERDENFVPYVRVHLKNFPSCTVVNYPESKRGKISAGFVSGVMPANPGLHFGRAGTACSRNDLLVCCLCGGSSNATDLGDLHGPYFPEGYKLASKVASNPDEDNSDSDPCARGIWTDSFHRPAESRSCSPTAKRSIMDGGIDWFSPPVVPLDASEHWLHEDCAVWSAGVFLVRGKVYGLEKAVRLAKVSVCSTCQNRGATLGCVFKGCPNKYHYMCAVQSGCVLNEDNFSMKCRKHKNKSIKGSSCGQINR
ncbi:transcription factor 20 [Pseudorasbora parva]|uniref:transcription factor 20 n=1 Tax=Pseudorasbora parva TaxID=51549 RepID=UPI00351E4808